MGSEWVGARRKSEHVKCLLGSFSENRKSRGNGGSDGQFWAIIVGQVMNW
jgi:hypothetical protein